MKLLLALASTACLLGFVQGWLERTKFAESYRDLCFGGARGPHSVVMGQRMPCGFTVSGFLDKLELLEEKLARELGRPQSAVDAAGYLLREFYYNDYRWTPVGIVDAHFTQDWRDVISLLFANMKPSAPNLPPLSRLLSEDETCFFVFSIAHNVNHTLVAPRFDTYAARNEAEVESEELPREEGVMTVTSSAADAVAIGRVLFGIEALRTSLREPTEIRELLGDNANISPLAKARELYALESGTLGATLGGLVLLFHREELERTLFLGGDWNGTGCFLEYKLESKTNHSATRAELLGAVDGYILGSYLAENPPLQKLKLSTILRAYYSTPGLLTRKGEHLTYCNRKGLYDTRKAASRLVQQLHNFAITLANKGRSMSPDKDSQAKREMDTILAMFEGKLAKYMGRRSEACNFNFSEDQLAFTSEAGTSAEQPKANLDSPPVFHELVGSKCFRQPKEAAEDDFHLAPSLDVFLSLVRRVERAHDGSDLFDVAQLLLHRFSLDHFEPAEMLRPREDVELKRTFLKTLLYPRSKRVPLAFDEDVLTTREKCALFLMLSHSLQGGSTNGSCRLETGVVSIDWQTDTLAVSVGKVLRGIVAARAARTVNVTELFLEAWPRRDLAGLDPSLVVRSDFAATVGSLLSVAAVETSLRANGGSAIGAEGSWTDPGCPSFYTVRSPRGTCTYALLRGAIDGFILGKHAHELANSGAALSEVLAGYYGGGGVPGAPHLSVCRRRELLRPYVLDGHLGEQVETLVEAYAFLLNERNAGGAKAAAARVTAQLLRRMRMDLLRNPRFCDLYPLTPESARCSTPADVHVVLDADASRNVTWMEQQRHVIRYLANFLQLSEGTNRRLHLYVNKKDIDGDIQPLLRNVTLPSTIACYVNALKLSELAADDEASTLESLQRRLLQDAKPLENATVIPSQTVVYFKFGNLRAPVRKLESIAARLLQVPEGALFAVGNDGDVLRSLSRQDIRTTVVLEPDRDGAERAARRIAGAACGVPASFQCLEYGTATTFKGDVAENAIIYGVLRPESCPQFAQGQLTVRAANGMVRFCKGGTENCDDVSEQGRSYWTPCKDGVCEPLQFALIGIAEAREEGGRPTGMVHYRIRYSAPLDSPSHQPMPPRLPKTERRLLRRGTVGRSPIQ